MSWKDNIIQPSFKGVEFKLDSNTKKGGRRVSAHEFPFKEKPASEDIGRKQKSFSVEGYVIGSNYHLDKIKLEDALDSEGPGELITPFWGILNVRCTEYTVEERNNRDGGMAVFSMSFIETGIELDAVPKDDPFNSLIDRVADVLDLSKNEFAQKFSVNGLPAAFIDSALVATKKLTNAVDNSFNLIRSQGDGVSIIKRKTSQINDNINKLLAAPIEFGNVISEAIALSGDNSSDKTGSFKAMSNVYEAGEMSEPELVGLTPNREQEKVNESELKKLQRRTSLTKLVEASTELTFKTIDEAYQTRDNIVAKLNYELYLIDDNDLYQAMYDLKKLFVALVPDTSSSIPKLKKIETQKTLPALAVIYQEFGSIEKVEDFIQRNSISNPAFIKGGEKYEVIE